MTSPLVAVHPAERTEVLVGVADSRSGQAALRMGAQLARTLALPLHLVRVGSNAALEAHERVVLDAAVALARYVAPSISVLAEFAVGDVREVLLNNTHQAHTLVLGAAENDGVPGLIGRWYLEHAFCPVLVVDANGRAVAGTLHASPFAAV
jgi:K+-sensing histidine kinase KdpD